MRLDTYRQSVLWSTHISIDAFPSIFRPVSDHSLLEHSPSVRPSCMLYAMWCRKVESRLKSATEAAVYISCQLLQRVQAVTRRAAVAVISGVFSN